MISMMLRNLVMNALAGPEGRIEFEERVTGLARAEGVELDETDLRELAALGERYVRETLRLMESCVTAASQARAERLLQPLITAAEGFYLRPCRYTPDQNGLLGMICESYQARRLIDKVSESMRHVRGFPLIAKETHPEAGLIRSLLGLDLAADLDEAVDEKLLSPDLRYTANHAYGLTGSLRATGSVSDWSVSLADEFSSLAASLGLRFA